MKTFNDEIKNQGGVEELDDDMLDGVAGGLVQPINPNSSRTHEEENHYVKFHDGRCCPTCGNSKWYCTAAAGTKADVRCDDCGYSCRVGITKIYKA
jgi:hypothetical protein